MAKAVEPQFAPDVPMTYRDFPAEIPDTDPVEIISPLPEPVVEPAKPAKKEN